MNEQKKLFKMIRAYSFAVYETVLYLDGHPDDKRALAYYARYSEKLKDATNRYEKRYGPLTVYGAGGADKWTWTATPWPWEYDSI
ncbi:MAG: spore coat protein CotJB [Clostridia bacterium]|nr:spore coat protein CotJB [Clostridia bacterium]